jgi:hypothetical protein
MRAWGWSLLAAVLPWTGPADSPSLPIARASTPCAITLDVTVDAPLHWDTLEWRWFTREVEQAWTPFGVMICWRTVGHGCEGLAIRLRVFVAERLPTSDGRPVVGRILFYGDSPGSEISLSLEGGRFLVAHATLGGRKLGEWPASIAERFLPVVMGRALAHELGHFLLASKAHARTGLMAAEFHPDEVTFGADGRFKMSPHSAGAIRLACVAGTLDSGGTSSTSTPSFAQ